MQTQPATAASREMYERAVSNPSDIVNIQMDSMSDIIAVCGAAMYCLSAGTVTLNQYRLTMQHVTQSMRALDSPFAAS